MIDESILHLDYSTRHIVVIRRLLFEETIDSMPHIFLDISLNADPSSRLLELRRKFVLFDMINDLDHDLVEPNELDVHHCELEQGDVAQLLK